MQAQQLAQPATSAGLNKTTVVPLESEKRVHKIKLKTNNNSSTKKNEPKPHEIIFDCPPRRKTAN
jgi:hypothetical protein